MDERNRTLTHFDREGRARMVDVSGKAESARTAVAEGAIRTSPETVRAILEGGLAKGDVLSTARIAGILAGKRTGELIPLCHILPEASIRLHFEADESLPGIRARAEAKISGRTGVEMEALVAVSLALLTIYDMAKSMDRAMSIEAVRLLKKEGGRSGSWRRSED